LVSRRGVSHPDHPLGKGSHATGRRWARTPGSQEELEEGDGPTDIDLAMRPRWPDGSGVGSGTGRFHPLLSFPLLRTREPVMEPTEHDALDAYSRVVSGVAEMLLPRVA